MKIYGDFPKYIRLWQAGGDRHENSFTQFPNSQFIMILVGMKQMLNGMHLNQRWSLCSAQSAHGLSISWFSGGAMNIRRIYTS
jgi:hypothetical protein